MTDHVLTLNQTERARTKVNLRPKDAATMMILDRSGTRPKVLMGKRHAGHKFMPGKYVFPGGRVDDGDRRMVATGAVAQICEDRLGKRCLRPGAGKARALALAAIRETFEETGLLFGSAEFGAPEAPPAGSWHDFAAQGVFPDLSAVTFVARAITPPRRPKRFDTRFFAIDASAVARRIEGVVGPDSELVDLVWVDFDEAKALDLPSITKVVIEEVEARIAAGFAPWLPVPFYWEKRGSFVREEL
ncbi:NUDIX hydrolase [Bosea sp. (in: a-proteobacteria)]|uniref:NUDIX hydrolase n=1 Tax=Bosea sp. (in: a-proteobacteria) TaxID=1871050 RepID=UPI00263292D0|nr:NUDIX hydrolase [Bosea sp. (in: a-proteobacteria)]MCO5092956.1 NUDIX hydrolase [Bosea sp. (in: a-proteobacteria)]